jgi:hypothetical protein
VPAKRPGRPSSFGDTAQRPLGAQGKDPHLTLELGCRERTAHRRDAANLRGEWKLRHSKQGVVLDENTGYV